MRVDQLGVNPYDGSMCGHAGAACMSVISCDTQYKNVETLMESHDLPRTGSAKWRILSA